METAALSALASVIVALGPGGILAVVLIPGVGFSIAVLILWYLYSRRMDKLLKAYRDDTNEALAQYDADQKETTQMYKDNVKLMEDANKTADALQTTLVRNTEALTILCESIRTNQYCPHNRIDKRARGPHHDAGPTS